MSVVLLAREAMRCRFEIVLPDRTRTDAERRAAGEEALDEIASWEDRLSAYRPGSDLYRLNAHASDSDVRVDARVIAFLERARDLTAATGGAFDLTIGPLLQVWGIGGSATRTDLPGQQEIDAARAVVGMADVVSLDPSRSTAHFSRPGVRLDPGALGKGYALDQAIDLLHELGIGDALLHGGTSSVSARGDAPGGVRGWRVAVAHPLAADAPLAFVTLHDTALSVSALHPKAPAVGGRAWGHVIDPRSGRPVSANLLAAAVAPSATDAEALSTALLVLGEAGAPELMARFPGANLLLVTRQAPGESAGIQAFGPAWKLDTSMSAPTYGIDEAGTGTLHQMLKPLREP